MSALKRDIRLLSYGWIVVIVHLVLAALLRLARFAIGLEEYEMYDDYPITWWIVVSLGFTFIASIIYSVKKIFDVHPNIQLRSKSDDVLANVLADPEYRLWHREAQKLLNDRRERRLTHPLDK